MISTSTMALLLKKAKSNGSDAYSGQRRASAPVTMPARPPSPSLAHLTAEELQILNEVFRKQQAFEEEESMRIKQITKNLENLEQQVRQQASTKSKLKQADLRLCRLCFKTKFADGIGRVCYDCHKRVCNRCGSFSKPRWNSRKNKESVDVAMVTVEICSLDKIVRGRWRCTVCLRKRELVCASGVWYHGDEAKPTINPETFEEKLRGTSGIESFSEEQTESFTEESSREEQWNKSDSELIPSSASKDSTHRSTKRMVRRKSSSAGSQQEIKVADEDENDLDDEQFILERQKCRHERQQQRKWNKKRYFKKAEEHYKLLTEGSKEDYRLKWIRCASAAVEMGPQPNLCDGVGGVISGSMGIDHENHIRTCQTYASSKRMDQCRKSHEAADGQIADDEVTIDDIPKSTGQEKCPDIYLNVPHFACSSPTRKALMRQDTHSSLSEGDSVGCSSPKRSHTFHGNTNRNASDYVLVKVQKRRIRSSGSQATDILRSPSDTQGMEVHPCRQGLSTSGSEISVFMEDEMSPKVSTKRFIPSVGVSPTEQIQMADSLPRCVSPTQQKQVMDSLRRCSISEISTSHSTARHVDDLLISPEVGKASRPVSKSPQTTQKQRSIPQGYTVTEPDGPVPALEWFCTTRPASERALRVEQPDLEVRRHSDGERKGGISLFNPREVIISRDKKDFNCRTMGLGMRVVGGKVGPDGILLATVTMVTSGGPADMQGIEKGDIILSWDGQSLKDATFEETHEAMKKSGDVVQLLVVHSANKKFTEPRTAFEQSMGSLRGSIETRSQPASAPGPIPRSPRRLLPKTPLEIKRETRHISGHIELQLRYDVTSQNLVVTILKATDLMPRESAEGEPPNAYVKVYLLPKRLYIFRTNPVSSSKNPTWNSTSMCPSIGETEIKTKSLEITVWDHYPRKQSVFLGEVLLDLSTTSLTDEPNWYPLADHDENSSPLPCSSPKPPQGKAAQTIQEVAKDDTETWKSLPLLPATPAHDRAKELLHRRHSPADSFHTPDSPSSKSSLPIHASGSVPHLHKKSGIDRNSRLSLIEFLRARSPSPSISSLDGDHHQAPTASGSEGSSSRRGSLMSIRRKMSDVVMKVANKLADKRSASFESSMSVLNATGPGMGRSHSIQTIEDGKPRADKSSKALAVNNAVNMDLLTPPMPRSRSNSQTSYKFLTSESDVDEHSYSPKEDRPPPEGDDVTSMLGPGQVPPKPTLEQVVHGDIKLGFMMTKGQLEINIISANINMPNTGKQPPDTYVKTYLMQGTKRLQKRKTRTIKASTEPSYQHIVKYSACNVYGRYMQILVKEKSSGFERNQCLGEVVIRLDSLDLSSHCVSWYKLFQESAMDIGSTESLVF